MSTSTATPPAWLEAAAKLDALLGDKSATTAAKAQPADEDETETTAGDDLEGEGDPAALGTPAEPSSPAARQEPRPPEKAKPRSRITPAIEPAASGDLAEEKDVVWLGVTPLALLPSMVALVAATGVAALVKPLVPVHVMSEAVDGPLIAVWLLQFIRGAYKLMGYNYRLTTRRLFRERGRLYPPEAPLDLATVGSVEAEQNRVERWLGVGTVRVLPESGTPWLLTGVLIPAVLAGQINEAVKAAREGMVSAARVST